MLGKYTIAILSFTGALTLSACSQSKESDDLAKAQQCLDEVPQSNPENAESCLQYVSKYDSQQANILKCSIHMTTGGLVENKVLKAYNALKDSTQTNKEAAFMAVLSLDKPNINDGYTRAVTADAYCQASGVSGLKYISGVIVAGSYMNKIIGGVDITNPSAIETQVQTMLNKCAPTPPTAIDPSCETDIAQLGTTVVTLSDAYCKKADADQSVCTQINGAVASAGGDTTDVGRALFCYLNKKTYNATTNECVP